MIKSRNPVVTDMKVIPVAGYDSMLMSLSGAHGPFFTRNLVLLTDSAGHIGIGEIHGGEYTRISLENCIPLVVGKDICSYRSVLNSIHKANSCIKKAKDDNGEGIQLLDICKLKFVVKAEGAIECAFLDLVGQYLGLRICDLLGEGQQRNSVETLGYLFYVSDKGKAKGLPYLDESNSVDPWYRMRRTEMLTPEKIVEQAQCLHEKYGFRNFKLKGGVMPGEKEVETVKLLKKQFPQARINIDPNGSWSLQDAIRLCKSMKQELTYVEDPCGPESGFSGREILCEFKNATHIPVATNMIATNWRQFYHAAALKSVDIVLADPHFWGLNGTIKMAQVLNDWGLTWGSHSNNHFDITLTVYAQVAAAAPGNPTPIDTHWIWQDGQNLCENSPNIRNGYLEVPDAPGLGIQPNMKKIMAANALYNKIDSKDRNDAIAMQFLIPNWKFNSKKPSLVR